MNFIYFENVFIETFCFVFLSHYCMNLVILLNDGKLNKMTFSELKYSLEKRRKANFT